MVVWLGTWTTVVQVTSRVARRGSSEGDTGGTFLCLLFSSYLFSTSIDNRFFPFWCFFINSTFFGWFVSALVFASIDSLENSSRARAKP